MSDPELAAAMQNPKVTAAFTEMMQNPTPAKMQELMSDPEVGPVLQKLIAKVGPGMGGMPGGGMGGMGGTPGGHDDDIPDIGDVDVDDLPDLE
jgi:suppressor of tumorigenicity protein 13